MWTLESHSGCFINWKKANVWNCVHSMILFDISKDIYMSGYAYLISGKTSRIYLISLERDDWIGLIDVPSIVYFLIINILTMQILSTFVQLEETS